MTRAGRPRVKAPKARIAPSKRATPDLGSEYSFLRRVELAGPRIGSQRGDVGMVTDAIGILASRGVLGDDQETPARLNAGRKYGRLRLLAFGPTTAAESTLSRLQGGLGSIWGAPGPEDVERQKLVRGKFEAGLRALVDAGREARSQVIRLIDRDELPGWVRITPLATEITTTGDFAGCHLALLRGLDALAKTWGIK